MSGSSEERDEWIERVLGVDLGRAGGADPLDLVGRLATAGRQLETLRAGGDAASLTELVGAHAAAVRAVEGKADNAGEMMDLLERQLSRARQDARYRADSAEFAGKVNYAQLLLRWHQCQSVALDRVEKIGDVLRTHPEVLSDEDTDELLDMIDDLPTLIPEFGDELDDVLDDARKPGADLDYLHDEARSILKKYRGLLVGMRPLQDLEKLAQNAGIGSMAIYRELEGTLEDLELELGKRG